MQEERYVTSHDGTDLYTYASGTGLPLVMCDGLGCDGFIWRYMKRFFAGRFRLVRWHHRGHGLSQIPKEQDALSVEDFVADLGAVLDSWRIDRAVLLSHSMGVQISLDFALRFPERVLGLVPICGSYGNPLDTFHDNTWALRAFPWIHRLVERFPNRVQRLWSGAADTSLAVELARFVEANRTLVQREDLESYLQHLTSMDVRVFFRVLRFLSQHSVEHRLNDIEHPALVVAGERDRFTPARLAQRMADLMPQAELLMIPGGSHVAPIEVPELIHLRLERFLENRVPDVGKTRKRKKNLKRGV